jgi:hypothetical protein
VSRSGAATGASTGPASQSSGAPKGVGARTTTTAAAAGAAFAAGRSYRPSQSADPYLFALPSSNAAALDYGAFIVPSGGDGRPALFGLGTRALRGVEPSLFDLLGLPDFLRVGRAQAVRRAGTELNALPDVKQVLGEQQAISDVGEGGGLTFGQLPLVALALVLVSSGLLVGAVLPPGVVARTPVSPSSYARAREPLALAALGILVPVAVVALVVALS